MHRVRILPKLAYNSIKKSAATYLPYIFATSFAVFVFFIFCAISGNEMMKKMPHAGYLLMLMQVGMVLLGFVLIPFLFYTNSFLMKQRKREMGLYSILGLEKKHIGLIIAAETLMVCAVSLTLGIIMALVFSKLIFLLLLNITRLPIDAQFTAAPFCYVATAAFFGGVFLLNLLINLFEVSRAKPSDLFQSARKGEKQPKHLWPTTLLGVVSLSYGYYLAVNFTLNSNFILIIFGAILLVILGTYCLFSSGIITFLRMLKKNQKFYYSNKNFVTVSGMLYRMRKNAASLSNICIFSTMVIITLVCTVSLFKGFDNIADYRYPYDVDLRFVNSQFIKREELKEKILTEAKSRNVNVSNFIEFEYMSMSLQQQGNSFQLMEGAGYHPNVEVLRVIRLEEYNRIENEAKTLAPNEILFFSTSTDLGAHEIIIGNTTYAVKEELQSLSFETKEPRAFNNDYYIVVADQKEQQYLSDVMKRSQDQWIYTSRFDIEGLEQDKEAYVAALGSWAQGIEGFSRFDNRVDGEKQDAAILGGLLFLGVFFGIIFMVCMIMIMYYKQLSEGYEDKTNFDVMQQVGMSQEEVKGTIRRQILTVFFLPLAVASLHTAIALGGVETMLNTLNLYNHPLIVYSTLGVWVAFAAVYIVSYHLTARAYYRIVRR